jgi:hypothetical protein
MNSEIKKIVEQIKKTQADAQGMMDDARKYAKSQGKELRSRFKGDAQKLRKNLQTLQKQIPGEVNKLRKYVDLQRKELETLVKKVGNINIDLKVTFDSAKGKKKSGGTKRASTTSRKKSAGSTGA